MARSVPMLVASLPKANLPAAKEPRSFQPQQSQTQQPQTQQPPRPGAIHYSVEERLPLRVRLLMNARQRGQRAGASTYTITSIAALTIATLAILALAAPACQAAHSYPRVGNLFEGSLRMDYAATLSKWDIVGFNASMQDFLPQMMPRVRQLNPQVKLLAYFSAGFICANCAQGSALIDGFKNKINQANWWLYDNKGNRIGEDNYLWYLNLTTKCPHDGSGQTLAQWLAHYIASQVMGSGYWDGVILDGCEEDVRWINSMASFFRSLPAGVDCNRDGVADNPDSLYAWWRGGLQTFLAALRQEAGASCIIVPNGNNYMYQYANGGIRENFPRMHGGWQENMFASYGYIPMCQNYLQQPMNATLLLCYYREGAGDMFAPPATQAFSSFMRFTLSSALLGDGYYFLDSGAAGSLWWQDYYDLDVGTPTRAARADTIVNHFDNKPCTIWTREFTNATVICNPYNQYVLLDDGTFLSPEDGAIKVHSLPGRLDCSVVRSTVDRDFTQRQRSFGLKVVVSNPSAKAAMAYVWLDLLTRDGTLVIGGSPGEYVIGVGRTDTLQVGMGVRSTLDLGTYCLRVRVGGPGKTTTDEDTVYITKILDFGKSDKTVNDDDKHAMKPNNGEDSLVVYPQPLLLAGAKTLTLRVNQLTSLDEGTRCSVKLYDATGRLVDTIFEGKLEDGRALDLGETGKGGVARVPGIYFLRIETRAKTVTKKIVLLN